MDWNKMSNVEIMGEIKRFISTSTIGTGLLNAEQATEFIDSLGDHTVMLKDAKQIQMASSTRNIDTIGMATRQLRKTTEGISPAQLIAVTTGQNVLTAVETIMPVEVSYAALRENIMKERLETLLINMIVQQYDNDLEDLFINGDTLSANDFLKINDGWIKIAKADGHVVDTEASVDQITIFGNMLDAMPADFDGDPRLKFYCATKDARHYRRSLGERGDGILYILQNTQPDFEGIPVVPVPKWPQGTYMLTPSSNLAYGIEQNIELERDRDIFRRMRQYALTTLTDAEFVVDDAIVIAYDVTP